MSLDNVLAVAGASRNYPYILVFGLVLSIALMGVAASFIASLLQKHRWIAYVGLAIILYVALDMCYRGAREVWPYAERLAGLDVALGCRSGLGDAQVVLAMLKDGRLEALGCWRVQKSSYDHRHAKPCWYTLSRSLCWWPLVFPS